MDDKKKQKLLKLARIADTGELGIIEYIVELEDKIDEAIPSFNELLKRVKGDKGDSPSDKELLALITPLIPPTPQDGHTPTQKELLALIQPLIPQVQDGKTPTKTELLAIIKPLIPQINQEDIIDDVYASLSEDIKKLIPTKESIEEDIKQNLIENLPQFGEQFRDGLELLQDEDRLDAKAIKGLDKYVKDNIKQPSIIGTSGVKEILAGTNITVDNTNPQYPKINSTGGGGGTDTPSFETVSKNLKAYPYALAYTGTQLTSMTYTLPASASVTKTFAYTGTKLTSITLAGDIPSGIDTIKTLGYTGDSLTSITYA